MGEADRRSEGETGVITGQVTLHEKGPALWPEYISLAELDKRREEVGTPIFNTMYQAQRGGLAGVIVKREFFKYRNAPEGSLCYAALDPAISQKTQADETAIVVGNVDYEGNVFIRFVWHGRVGVRETLGYIDEVYQHYRPVEFGVESVAYQAALIEIAEDKYPDIPFVPVKPDKDKFSRFLALGALYEFGRVFHHPYLEASAFEYQLTRLPNGAHDDMADAASMMTILAGLSGPVTTGDVPEGFR